MSVKSQMTNFENKPFRTAMLWLVMLIVLGTVGSVVMNGLSFFTETAQVARQEFGPKAMLKKYEWFKNASASIQKSEANLNAYELRMTTFKKDYKGVPKSKWARDERQAYNQLHAEYQGMLQMFNAVVADYNAQSNKFNWAMFDQTDGDMVVKRFNIRSPI